MHSSQPRKLSRPKEHRPNNHQRRKYSPYNPQQSLPQRLTRTHSNSFRAKQVLMEQSWFNSDQDLNWESGVDLAYSPPCSPRHLKRRYLQPRNSFSSNRKSNYQNSVQKQNDYSALEPKCSRVGSGYLSAKAKEGNSRRPMTAGQCRPASATPLELPLNKVDIELDRSKFINRTKQKLLKKILNLKNCNFFYAFSHKPTHKQTKRQSVDPTSTPIWYSEGVSPLGQQCGIENQLKKISVSGKSKQLKYKYSSPVLSSQVSQLHRVLSNQVYRKISKGKVAFTKQRKPKTANAFRVL